MAHTRELNLRRNYSHLRAGHRAGLPGPKVVDNAVSDWHVFALN